MEDLLQTIRNLKTRAKNRRDLGRYERAVRILEEEAIPLIQKELSSTSLADWRAQLASELSDCFGILGGLYRRWALETETEQERKLHLRKSVDAYEKGYEIEKNPKHNIINSYNMLNRILSYIFLEPDSLWDATPSEKASYGKAYDVRQELQKIEAVIREQLKEKRRGDIWALADLALVRLLLGNDDPVVAYADFNAKSPPDFAYESALSTLRPLAKLRLPVADKLSRAVELLEEKLGQLQGSSQS
ncbi:MAG TPA: tetratricopeptide repeat-containing protein [Pyrinomonadaceae bacterium]|jgi:hypothetical protein